MKLQLLLNGQGGAEWEKALNYAVLTVHACLLERAAILSYRRLPVVNDNYFPASEVRCDGRE